MTSYWSQFELSEINSMHGNDIDDAFEDDEPYMGVEAIEEDDSCPRCSGSGCGYCLMLE